jgi:hypothetical protein
VLQVALAHRRGSNDQRAILYGLGYGFVSHGVFEDFRSSNGGARFAKRWRERIHDAERLKSEIAHGPRGRPNV